MSARPMYSGWVARAPIAAVGALALALATGCGSSTDPRPASWSYLSAAIMKPSCATASCHGPAAAVAGLDFSTEDRGYISLTGLWIWIVDPMGSLQNGCQIADNTIVCPRERRPLVVPFDPAQSRLVHMLRAEGAPRMPPDRPLPDADIRLVESWIANGAARGRGSIPGAEPIDGGSVVSGGDGAPASGGDGHVD